MVTNLNETFAAVQAASRELAILEESQLRSLRPLSHWENKIYG